MSSWQSAFNLVTVGSPPWDGSSQGIPDWEGWVRVQCCVPKRVQPGHFRERKWPV